MEHAHTVQLPALEYAYDDLGRSISKDIMKLHHSKHHQTYVDNLNSALEGRSELAHRPVEDLLRSLNDLPDEIQQAVRDNGGGHYNHSLFWKWMSPDGGGEPAGQLRSLLETEYQTYQKFVDQFTKQALGVFGSGWAWLMPDMSIVTTPNQDNPLTLGLQEPILGLDVWEHAYYLDYKNRRADYVKAWWDVVNWEFATERFTQSY